MKRFLVALCAAGLLFIGCGSDKTSEQPASKVETPAPVEETSSPQWANLPETFSATPSIGATRAEFEKYHHQNASNGVGNIRYDNDEYLVTYTDENYRASDNKDARIFILMIQAVEGKVYDLNLFIPSDCDTLEIVESLSDDRVISKEFTGHSAELEKVFPKYGGKFAHGVILDKKTNAFIGATFRGVP